MTQVAPPQPQTLTKLGLEGVQSVYFRMGNVHYSHEIHGFYCAGMLIVVGSVIVRSYCIYVLICVGSQASEVVVISNDTTLRTGETAVLACVGFGEPEVEISWSFNGEPVVNTSLITISEEDVVRGERIFKQSFLQICSLAEADAGGYTCIASDGFTADNATTQLTVTGDFFVLFICCSFFVCVRVCVRM